MVCAVQLTACDLAKLIHQCNLNGEKMEKIFNGIKSAKLGTAKNPASVHVQTQARAQEVESVFQENGWKYKITVEPDAPEDITDLEILLNPQTTRMAGEKVGRNDPCPCGSGNKYKKCCGR